MFEDEKNKYKEQTKKETGFSPDSTMAEKLEMLKNMIKEEPNQGVTEETSLFDDFVASSETIATESETIGEIQQSTEDNPIGETDLTEFLGSTFPPYNPFDEESDGEIDYLTEFPEEVSTVANEETEENVEGSGCNAIAVVDEENGQNVDTDETGGPVEMDLEPSNTPDYLRKRCQR